MKIISNVLHHRSNRHTKGKGQYKGCNNSVQCTVSYSVLVTFWFVVRSGVPQRNLKFYPKSGDKPRQYFCQPHVFILNF